MKLPLTLLCDYFTGTVVRPRFRNLV